MAHRVILHLMNEDPIVAELDRMPEPEDTSITVFDPRREDGKQVHYLRDGSTAVVFPLHRISSIEVFTEDISREEEVTFYRDETS